MAHEPLKRTAIEPESRPPDPNVVQRRASFPAASSWVAASAGTGKTKVLSDRVLRLLLPGENGKPGTEPHKILCLTFTKAAAGEMAIRITGRLSKWATMEEEELRKDLEHNLLGRAPTEADCLQARKLFARVLDTPGGLKIMTIHAFCQSVLKRFPLEAGVNPHFEVLEDKKAEELLMRSINRIVGRASRETGSNLHLALENMASELNEEQLRGLLKDFCRERKQLHRIVNRFWDGQGVHAAICDAMEISSGDSEENLVRAACLEESFSGKELQCVRDALSASDKKTDRTAFEAICGWLESSEKDRPGIFDQYVKAFLTAEHRPRSKLPTSTIAAKNPECLRYIEKEAERLIKVLEKCKRVHCAASTMDLFTLGAEISKEYARIKETHAVLDYDDLILCTLELLENGQPDSAQWVMYKLDQGIDHILIDEAQDTNPEQWLIVRSLCSEFFSGAGARENVSRTLFTVGDIKQSIYSFQRAAPEEFHRMHCYFEEKAANASLDLHNVPLNISFRTTQTILDLVDETFSDPPVREGLGPEYNNHVSFRTGQAGIAELWPLQETEGPEETSPWEIPVTGSNIQSGPSRLAAQTASQIRKWLDKNEELPSRGRPIEPGDILILVRTRNAFAGQLMRELKLAGIPVSGMDRMVLKDQLAVQDLLAFVQFALLPEDDLNLACLLKSPLVGISEEELFELAHSRSGSLWSELQSSSHQETTEYLKNLIRSGSTDLPYEFLAGILQNSCPADPSGSGFRAIKARLGDEVVDPLEELLGDALACGRYEIPSLQGFLQEQLESGRTIKREQEEAGSKVRIMTIHGAKGLQAPIVILPDTVRTKGSGKVSRFLWPDKTGLEVPLWSPRSTGEPEFFRTRFDEITRRQEDEYRRLLYVALTRAEDRLYIAGAAGRKCPDPQSWYYYVRSAMERLNANTDPETGAMRLESPQTRKADRVRETDDGRKQETGIPDWLFRKAPEEPRPPRPLMPSRPSGEPDDARPSPLASSADTYRFRRGNITHKLLQFLPEIPQDIRRQTAVDFVSHPGHKLPAEILEDIVRETMSILEDPELGLLFGPGSAAEVPVTGLLGPDRIVSGQIDRMVVTEDEVLVVDYKTNRPPPHKESEIPQMYIRQMRAYREVLRNIYPEREIRCFLLWTDGPLLSELTDFSK